MALHFSANQYNSAFDPKLLQNWQVPRQFRERPRRFDGFTQIVASDRGHLLPGVKRSRESPWGTFVGTYDMPLKIPGNTNPTGRTGEHVEKLLRSKTDGEIILKGKLKKCRTPEPLPVKEDVSADHLVDPTLPVGLIATVSDARSGARNPEPLTASPKFPTIGSRVVTPNLNWPKPGFAPRSAGSRGSPKMMSPKVGTPQQQTCVAFAGTPDQELQRIASVRTPINWPSPKSPVLVKSPQYA